MAVLQRRQELIVGSKLKAEYIDHFVQGRRYGKIWGVTVVAKRPTDLKAIRTLIDIKGQLKCACVAASSPKGLGMVFRIGGFSEFRVSHPRFEAYPE